jgi:cytochrome c oxidase accessory protein FixG
MGTAIAPEPEEQVLSTLNKDGSRRWIRPKLSTGRFYYWRLGLAWFLIAIFTVIPYVKVRGKPLILLDIPNREFTLFGTTFLPTDTFLLALLLLGIVVGIFLLTALFGRVWCGWACPQTVYMEFLYRPIERWIEGKRSDQLKLDRQGGGFRRMFKNGVFLILSVFLAHTFLAYFVGVETLFRWVRQSPLEHSTAFAVMLVTTMLMLADFGYFREQVCIVACPYGRFQSVLLDRKSLVIGYDYNRGEPRGKLRKGKDAGDATPRGDCIDCNACVVTCPTGIDIRDGVQMECIGCTQCIDACDVIMDRIGKPRGLVRYTSQDTLATGETRILRPRVVAYPALLIAVLGVLTFALVGKDSADVTLLRGIGSPFMTLPSGEVSNQLRIKIVNRSDEPRDYRVEIVDDEGLELVAPENPIALDEGDSSTATVFVVAPVSEFTGGRREVRIRVSDGLSFDRTFDYRLLGPHRPAGPAGGGGS